MYRGWAWAPYSWVNPTSIYKYIYVYVYICIFIHIYTYIYIYIYIYVCVWVYIYIWHIYFFYSDVCVVHIYSILLFLLYVSFFLYTYVSYLFVSFFFKFNFDFLHLPCANQHWSSRHTTFLQDRNFPYPFLLICVFLFQQLGAFATRKQAPIDYTHPISKDFFC